MIGFARALTCHQLLSRELTDTILAGTVEIPGITPPPGSDPQPPGPPPKYAYGFIDRQINGLRIVGPNGGTPGYEAELDIYPETGHAVVVLANQDRARTPVMRRSEELLTG